MGFRTIYHDCSTTPTYDSFLAASIRSWRPDAPPNAPTTLGGLLQSPPADKPLVLLFDEADKLVPDDRATGWRLFNMLRSLVNSNQMQIVLSGERSLRDALRDSASPLFNFTNEIVLGPLDYQAVEVLITQPMQKLEIELEGRRDIIEYIWDFTSGHPNVVQRLCRRLVERLNKEHTRRVTLDDVNTVIEDPTFQRKDFLDTYWETATHLEKIISLLMADNEDVRTLAKVRRVLHSRCHLQPSAREVDDALQRLVDLRSILKRTPNGYAFAVAAFPLVVARTVTLNDMLEVLIEEYQDQNV
jgi:Cdc6-like AAA superfamily ATPase